MGAEADLRILQAHRTYPTRNTPAQQEILARGRTFLADDRAFRKLGNEGMVYLSYIFIPSYSPFLALVLLLHASFSVHLAQTEQKE